MMHVLGETGRITFHFASLPLCTIHGHVQSYFFSLTRRKEDKKWNVWSENKYSASSQGAIIAYPAASSGGDKGLWSPTINFRAFGFLWAGNNSCSVF